VRPGSGAERRRLDTAGETRRLRICGRIPGIFGALSADGSTAIIGGTDDNHRRGAAWVFTRTAECWSAPALWEMPVTTFSVCLSADGTTALVGGYADAKQTGAAWVFVPAVLRLHGIIKKVGKTYKYYLTEFGRHVALAGLTLKNLFLVPEFAAAALAH
jgi:hypothetical protein